MRIEVARVFLEHLHAGRQAAGRLVVEPDAGRLGGAVVQGDDGFGSSAATVGDHRRAAGLGFHGHDAEILFSRK